MIKENEALVSVIVPIYNSEQYLRECCESILNQTYGNLEVILVDDGSSDSSAEICDNYANCDERVKVIYQLNGGVSAARNKGLDVSTGEFVAFVDSDDFIDITMIEKMLNVAKENDLDAVVCGMAKVTSDGYMRPMVPNWSFDVPMFTEQLVIEALRELRVSFGGGACGILLDGKIARSFKFDEAMRLHEDQKWILEVFRKCSSGIHMEDALYYYRDNAGSATKKYLKNDLEDKNHIDGFVRAYVGSEIGDDETMVSYVHRHSFYVDFEKYVCGLFSGIEDVSLRIIKQSLKLNYGKIEKKMRNKRMSQMYLLGRAPKCIFRAAWYLKDVLKSFMKMTRRRRVGVETSSGGTVRKTKKNEEK